MAFSGQSKDRPTEKVELDGKLDSQARVDHSAELVRSEDIVWVGREVTDRHHFGPLDCLHLAKGVVALLLPVRVVVNRLEDRIFQEVVPFISFR